MKTLYESLLGDIETNMAVGDKMELCPIPNKANFNRLFRSGILGGVAYYLDWDCGELIEDYIKDLNINNGVGKQNSNKHFDKNAVKGIRFIVSKQELRMRFYDKNYTFFAPFNMRDYFNGNVNNAKTAVLKICQSIAMEPSLISKVVDTSNKTEPSRFYKSLLDVLELY
jgi:hypothetical protein